MVEQLSEPQDAAGGSLRTATPSDRYRVVALMRNYHRALGLPDGIGPSGLKIPFQASYADRLFARHLQPDAYALVYTPNGVIQGLLLAVKFQHPFGDVWMAKDTMWWVEPAHRGLVAIRMLGLYEAWTKEQRCSYAGMAGMGEDPNIDGLLKRRGYTPVEKNYLKKVN